MTRRDEANSATPRKRSHDDNNPSSSGSSSSDEPSRKKHRKSKKHGSVSKNGEVAMPVNGAEAPKNRRNSMVGKAARDPRDEPLKKRKASTGGEVARKSSASPSPVIDFDGLSRPSMQHLAQILPTLGHNY